MQSMADELYDSAPGVDVPTYEAPEPAPAPVAVAETDETDAADIETIVASANQPGPNAFNEREGVEAETVEETVEVSLDDEAPYDEAFVSVPGIDPEADYVEITSVELADGNGEPVTYDSARIKLSSTPVTVPAVLADGLQTVPHVKVAV